MTAADTARAATAEHTTAPPAALNPVNLPIVTPPAGYARSTAAASDSVIA